MGNKVCYYLCCCSDCCSQRNESFQKTGAYHKKLQDLKTLDQITPTSKSDSVWAQTNRPNDISEEQMTDIYQIPTDKFKTETEVFQHLGYKINRQIDSGSFGVILTAFHIKSNLKIAIKKITIPEPIDRKHKEKREQLLKDVKNELYALQKIRHPHVVKLIQHMMIKTDRCLTLHILMQFASNGNLEIICESKDEIKETQCKRWFAQILSGLSFMHEKGIAHRDLKCANILLDSAFDVLIADFGLSKLVWRQSQKRVLMSNTFCGTPPYMAPEVLMIKSSNISQYNPMCADVWSLGVILYVVYSKMYPFPRKSSKAVRNMNSKTWKFPKDRNPSPELQQLLTLIFEPEPLKRIDLKGLSQHKWVKNAFNDVEKKSIEKMKTLTQTDLY